MAHPLKECTGKKDLRIDFLWSYKLLMKERQFGVSTIVVAKGKFRNGGKEKEKGRGVFLPMGVLCGRGPLIWI
jgi:hypothetical protein